MNYFRWNFKSIKSNRDLDIDMQFGAPIFCIIIAVASLLYCIYHLFNGMYLLSLILALTFVVSLVFFFLCGKKIKNIYVIAFLFYFIDIAVIHMLITYDFGLGATLFLVFAAFVAHHFYPVFKPRSTILIGVFFLLIVNINIWLSYNTIPKYADNLKVLTNIIITNLGLLISMLLLYLNLFMQYNAKSKRQKMLDTITKEASQDMLTGLGNRKMLNAIRDQMAQSVMEYTPIFVAYADLDFFKKINDTYGHAVGDEVLRHTARVMESFFRKGDVLIRYGGEEFLIILRKIEANDVKALIEKFRQKLQKTPMTVGGKPIQVCVTIGLIEHDPERSIEETIQKADELMYKGKLQSRNCVIADF
jgi:diguanylate cyclase (GGDEF)-like protein